MPHGPVHDRLGCPGQCGRPRKRRADADRVQRADRDAAAGRTAAASGRSPTTRRGSRTRRSGRTSSSSCRATTRRARIATRRCSSATKRRSSPRAWSRDRTSSSSASSTPAIPPCSAAAPNRLWLLIMGLVGSIALALWRHGDRRTARRHLPQRRRAAGSSPPCRRWPSIRRIPTPSAAAPAASGSRLRDDAVIVALAVDRRRLALRRQRQRADGAADRPRSAAVMTHRDRNRPSGRRARQFRRARLARGRSISRPAPPPGARAPPSGRQVIAVTSAGSGDGKSVTTLNVAGSLAQSRGARVLVIDADLHRPSVGRVPRHRRAGRAGPRGRHSRRADAAWIESVQRDRRPRTSRCSWRAVGESSAYELLNSPRFEALLNEARARFDYVIVDTPPLIPLPDCRLIGRWVDGFLMVVCANRTPRKALRGGARAARSGKVIGIVFNGDDRPLGASASYYAYASEPAGVAQAPGRGRWWRRALDDRRSRSGVDSTLRQRS